MGNIFYPSSAGTTGTVWRRDIITQMSLCMCAAVTGRNQDNTKHPRVHKKAP